MTYDNTDSDADSVVDADVDNTALNAEYASTKQLNDNIYPASEYATNGSGTDSDPYTDGIQAAFDQAAADGRRIVRVEIDGEFDLSSQVNPPAFYSWEVVGTGNFNFIKGTGTEPVFQVDNEVHSPRFHNFRARNIGGQSPFVRFDVEGIGNFVEPWFSWIEFDRNWRAIEVVQGSTTNAGLMELQNCWFHYGLQGESGNYYIKQTSSGAQFGGVSAKGCRFWLDGSETADGFQGGIDLENAFLEIELRDCRAVDAGSGAWLKATNTDSTANQPDAEIKDNYIKCGTTDTADHAERLFVFNNGGYINISGNTVRGSVDKALGFATITDALRYEIDDNPVSPNVFSGDALNIDNSAIGEINQVGYEGVAGSRSFNTWYRNDDPTDKYVKVTVQASADGTTVNAILDVSFDQSNDVTDQVRRTIDTNETDTLGATVPANFDYQVRAFGDTGTYDILAWREK
jgi:hypothetical protein